MNKLISWLQQDRRKLHSFSFFWAVTFTALLLVPVHAQDQSDTDQSTKTGRVTGDDVRLRGGPGTKFKPVGTVSSGTTLRIRRQEGDWTEVVPPEQATVWIYGKFVDATDSGSGTVTATDVNIRPLPRVDRSNVPLGQVSSPETVTIVDRKSGSDEEFPWYEIRLPDRFSAWIHSDYVEVQSAPQSSGSSTTEQNERTQDSSDASTSSGPSSQTSPQKGAVSDASPQKGASGGSPGSNEPSGQSVDASKWVDQLNAIQDRVRKERNRDDKLQWDFSSHIQDLEAYAANVPLDRLKKRADELRKQLEDLQQEVNKERKRLNERLREIQEERKAQVRNTIQDVLQAKGFSWDYTGQVRSVGTLYYERPADYELVKGGRRICFLQAARDILELRNYRGLLVAVSGTEISPDGKQWDEPILRVDKIEPIGN